MKEYEIQGVMDYAHCETRIIKAKNKKETLKIFKGMVDRFIDPAMAEFQKLIVNLDDVNELEEQDSQSGKEVNEE